MEGRKGGPSADEEGRKVQVSAVVESATLAELDVLAKEDRRSRAEMIRFAIQEFVERRKASQSAKPNQREAGRKSG
jgi:metal-responsive CopG/Arc/MetJ family transcriptional regulator